MTDLLYGTPPSYYTGKVRAYLDWKGTDYREVMPDPQVIVPAVGRMVIPVMQLEDGRLLQDSTVIIDHYEASIDGASIYPSSPRQKFAALLFENYGDEWLVIPAMHYRWNYNEEWAFGEFGRFILPRGSPDEQFAAGKAVGENFRGFTPMLGVNEATIPAIEASYEALLADLNAHFAEHDFLFGTRPSIGDFGLYGPLFAHLYRDPESGKLMRRLAPQVVRWVERMMDPEAQQSGEFLEGDEVPATLLPILRRMMREQLPYLARTAELMAAWGEASNERELPRAVGQAEYTVEGTTSARFATPFSLWMIQRATDCFAGMDEGGREACMELLRDVGGEALLELPMPFRLKFENHRLWRG